MKKITFFGAYTLNNIGDDMFFYALENMFQSHYGNNFLFSFLCYDPKNMYECRMSHEYIYSKNMRQVIHTIKRNDILIIGPWSIFWDQWKFWKQNTYILLICIIARFYKKKILFYGIDLATSTNMYIQMTQYMCLILSSRIYIRFPCLKYKYFLNKIHNIHDVVYSEYFSNMLPSTQQKIIPWDLYDVIIFSDLRHIPWYQNIEKFFLHILKSYETSSRKVYVLFLNIWPWNIQKDKKFFEYLLTKQDIKKSAFIYKEFPKWDLDNIQKVFDIFFHARYIISSKLHASIIATLWWVWLISLNYHYKMSLLNKDIELDKKFEYNLWDMSEKSLEEYSNRIDETLFWNTKTEICWFKEWYIQKYITQNAEHTKDFLSYISQI